MNRAAFGTGLTRVKNSVLRQRTRNTRMYAWHIEVEFGKTGSILIGYLRCTWIPRNISARSDPFSDEFGSESLPSTTAAFWRKGQLLEKWPDVKASVMLIQMSSDTDWKTPYLWNTQQIATVIMIMPRTITPIATDSRINITLRSVRMKKLFSIPNTPTLGNWYVQAWFKDVRKDEFDNWNFARISPTIYSKDGSNYVLNEFLCGDSRLSSGSAYQIVLQ